MIRNAQTVFILSGFRMSELWAFPLKGLHKIAQIDVEFLPFAKSVAFVDILYAMVYS